MLELALRFQRGSNNNRTGWRVIWLKGNKSRVQAAYSFNYVLENKILPMVRTMNDEILELRVRVSELEGKK